MKMRSEQYLGVAAWLRKLSECEGAPGENLIPLSAQEINAGLCTAFKCKFGSSLIACMAEGLGIGWSEWPGFSGVTKYPVPGNARDDVDVFRIARTTYGNSDYTAKWAGAYGERRKKLCAWLATRIESEVEKLQFGV